MTQDTEDVVARLARTETRTSYMATNRTAPPIESKYEELINPDGPDAIKLIQSLSDRIDVLEGALNAIIDGSARRHVKWSGMLAPDIARAALHQEATAP